MLPNRSLQLLVDGWVNIATGLGMQHRDKRLQAVFSQHRVLGQQELDALFSDDWMVARACSRPANDQCRRWVDIKVDGKKGGDDDVADELDTLSTQAKLQEAITWARLHGGALIVMGLDDGMEPWEPVIPERIKGVQWINVIDRWDAVVTGWYGAQTGRPYGDPELYQMATTILAPDGEIAGLKFHETRAVRVDGVLTSRRQRLNNAGWNYGVIQRLFEVIRDWHAAVAGAAHLTTDFSQAVIKIKGLAKALAEDNDGLVTNRLQALDLMRSLVRMIPLDEDESFERVPTPISGLPELLKQLRDNVCGACDIPEKILFGQATAGLGDQGQSDLEQYDNQMVGEQRRNVIPQLTRLVGYLYQANGGEPKRWHVEPRPLREPGESETSENRKRDAETDTLNITSGVYTADEARASRYGGDGYGREIVIETDDKELDAIPSATDDGPEEVREVTGVVINAALGVVEKIISGDITITAGKVLLQASLRLDPTDIDKMLEGIEEERARRQEMAAKIAAGAGPNGEPNAGPPGAQPPGGSPPSGGGPAPDPDSPPHPDDEPPDRREDSLVTDYVEKRGSKWVVLSKAGEILGEHESEEAAKRQLAAIEAHKHQE